MNSSVDGQQRRIVVTLVRRNLQGWGRPLDFTVQRLRLGVIFGGLGVLFFFVRQLVTQTQLPFFITVFTLLAFLSFAMCVSFLVTHAVPFVRARNQSAMTITGKLEAVICNPQEYSSLARGEYYYVTLRPTSGPLRAYAVEAAHHADICDQQGQQVTLEVIPGIDYVVRIR